MNQLRLFGAFAIAMAMSFAAACGDDEASTSSSNTGGNPQGGSGATGAAGGTGGGTSTGGAGPCDPITLACIAPEPAHLEQTLQINTIDAVVMGTDGSPANGITTKVCGTDICSDILSAEPDGSTSIPANGMFKDPRFVYGDGKEYGEMAVLLATADADRDFGQVHAIRLPDIASGAELVPGNDVTNSGITLSIPDGAVLDHDCLLYSEDELTFRANAVDAGAFNFPAVDLSGVNIEVVVALAPINTVICPAAALTVPNVAGWTPGAEVEFYVHGHLTFKHYAPYGEWSKVAEGVVDGDGTTITTKAGEGIELIATYGLVLK